MLSCNNNLKKKKNSLCKQQHLHFCCLSKNENNSTLCHGCLATCSTIKSLFFEELAVPLSLPIWLPPSCSQPGLGLLLAAVSTSSLLHAGPFFPCTLLCFEMGVSKTLQGVWRKLDILWKKAQLQEAEQQNAFIQFLKHPKREGTLWWAPFSLQSQRHGYWHLHRVGPTPCGKRHSFIVVF